MKIKRGLAFDACQHSGFNFYNIWRPIDPILIKWSCYLWRGKTPQRVFASIQHIVTCPHLPTLLRSGVITTRTSRWRSMHLDKNSTGNLASTREFLPNTRVWPQRPRCYDVISDVTWAAIDTLLHIPLFWGGKSPPQHPADQQQGNGAYHWGSLPPLGCVATFVKQPWTFLVVSHSST